LIIYLHIFFAKSCFVPPNTPFEFQING
jgi:hypothetical protein